MQVIVLPGGACIGIGLRIFACSVKKISIVLGSLQSVVKRVVAVLGILR